MTRHVLVVDDDDSIREVARMALELVGGWRVSTASSGIEAKQLVRQLDLDVVLMDFMMPGLDGISALAQMQEDPEMRTPVIMMTAKDVTEEHQSHVQLAGIIPKPFDPLTLADEVSSILGWTS